MQTTATNRKVYRLFFQSLYKPIVPLHKMTLRHFPSVKNQQQNPPPSLAHQRYHYTQICSEACFDSSALRSNTNSPGLVRGCFLPHPAPLHSEKHLGNLKFLLGREHNSTNTFTGKRPIVKPVEHQKTAAVLVFLFLFLSHHFTNTKPAHASRKINRPP